MGESAFLLFALALLLGGLLAVTFLRPDIDVYFACFTGLTLLLAVPFVVGCVTRRLDPFEPATIIATSYFLYFVYDPIRNLMAGDYYFFGTLIMPVFPLGSLYLGLGIIGMWAGYYSLGVARHLAKLVPEPPRSSSGMVPYAWIVTALALIAFNAYAHIAGISWVRLLTLGQLGSASRALQDSASSAGSAFSNYLYSTIDWLTSALMLFYAFSQRGRKWLIPGFVALFLIYTTIGFRFRVVVLVFAPVVYYYLRARRRPGVFKLCAAAIGIMLLIGAIGMLRGSFRTGRSVEPNDISIASSSESFASDLDIYQGYLAIVNTFPVTHNYLFGSSFAYLFIQPIPRTLWPDKPEAPVATIIYVILGSDAARAGIAYPNVGEYYANFGMVGMFGCMWLFGLSARVLYEYLWLHEDSAWVRVVYAVSFPFIVQVVSRGYFVAIVQEGAFLLLPLVVGMRICRRSDRRPRQRELKSDRPALMLPDVTHRA